MPQYTLSNLQALMKDTMTDADSPVSQELMDRFRLTLESVIIALLSTGTTGSATSDPPNDSTGVLTDTGAFTVDKHNYRTLLITSGQAIGNLYTIDDTTVNTLVCTDDNLYADGVRSGNTYLILYDLLTNAGHDHDGINSKELDVIRMALSGPETYTTSSTSLTSVLYQYFYKTADMETIYYKFEHYISDALYESQCRINVNGTAGTTHLTNNVVGSPEVVSSSLDISGIAAGWIYISFEMKSTDAGETATMRRLGTYVD